MTTHSGNPDTSPLMERASRGDSEAKHALLLQHRDRLKRMVALRIDRRVSARVDPSDVVQEALIEAWQELPEYLEKRPIAFYPWLRRITWERLVKLHRLHIEAQRRSVRREVILRLPDRSSLQLARSLVRSGTSPSGKLIRKELYSQVCEALESLPDRDREVLVLTYLEQLSRSEMAAVLGISESAAGMRHLRALQRIHRMLSYPSQDEDH